MTTMAFLILTYLGLYEDCLSSATGGGKGCLEGGLNLTPGSDRDLCLLLPGRDPSELKRRTATSRSVKGRDEFCKLLLYMYKLCSRTNLHHNLKSIFEVLITGLRTSWLTFIISRFEPAFDCLGSSWFHHFTDGLMAQKKLLNLTFSETAVVTPCPLTSFTCASSADFSIFKIVCCSECMNECREELDTGIGPPLC